VTSCACRGHDPEFRRSPPSALEYLDRGYRRCSAPNSGKDVGPSHKPILMRLSWEVCSTSLIRELVPNIMMRVSIDPLPQSAPLRSFYLCTMWLACVPGCLSFAASNLEMSLLLASYQRLRQVQVRSIQTRSDSGLYARQELRSPPFRGLTRPKQLIRDRVFPLVYSISCTG